MPILKYIRRMQRIDSLIRRKNTGTSEELAAKLHLSRSATMEYLHEMRQLGFPIHYDKIRQCFYYDKKGKMTESLFEEHLSADEMGKEKGGSSGVLNYLYIRK